MQRNIEKTYAKFQDYFALHSKDMNFFPWTVKRILEIIINKNQSKQGPIGNCSIAK